MLGSATRTPSITILWRRAAPKEHMKQQSAVAFAATQFFRSFRDDPVRWILFAIAFVILLSCGPSITKAPPPESYAWPETVRGWDACLDRFHCPRWAPYVHGEDPQVGEIWWLVSVSGRACEIPPDAAYRLGSPFTCRWRARRGV